MKNKIATGICLGVVGLFIVSVLVLYFTPINYAPKLNQPFSISITKTSDTAMSLNKSDNKTEYTEFITKFNSSFTRSLLSALLAGQNSSVLNMTSNELPLASASSLNDFTGYKIRYIYDVNHPQTLVVDGHTHSQKYTEIVFEVSDNANYKSSYLYFKQANSTDRYYKMETYSIQAGLYDYITSLNL